MRAHYGAVALLTFTACVRQPEEVAPAGKVTESASAALGVVPASETAQWKRVGSTTLPSPRFGQALAMDETSGVLVMFGGLTEGQSVSQDLWEWNPAAGTWKIRTTAGTVPDARSGAALAYDSTHKKFVLFGGRSGSGYDLQDTWEWDPATGAWTDKTDSGASPSARSQHGMVFDSKTGKVVLFGGGRSQLGGDPMSLSVALADTWEYDGARWTQRPPAAAPSARAAFGFAYSSGANKAYLFGGTEIPIYNAPPTLKQDIWEYDGTTGIWTERTATGSKPSPRFGHSMAIDDTNGQAVVFGGFDINTSGSKNDVWYWSLANGKWQGHDAAGGALWPGKRMWASLVAGSTTHPFLVAGLVTDSGGGYDAGLPPFSGSSGASREIWELNPSTTTWVNRSAPNDNPGSRYSHAITADPVTGKIYLFGGTDMTGNTLNDLWEWNGTKWVECTGEVKPPARSDSAMTYDPVRKSLILFGGNSLSFYTGWDVLLSDTWEWNTSTRKWTQLTPTVSPGARTLHAMVTDTARQKVILFGGQNMMPILYPQDGGVKIPTYELWEWDGANSTWTDRSPYIRGEYPNLGSPPAVVYDEGSKKVALFGFNYYGAANASYWEWDTNSGALSSHVITDTINVTDTAVVYDSIRRRTIAAGTPMNSLVSSPPLSTCELDSAASTWYLRTIAEAPTTRSSGMAFDRVRGVVVLYGGRDRWAGTPMDDTWEYRVGSWGNGTGCTAGFASQCASGNCVDGVCCESASCTGACKSCNVAGKAGTCVLAAPGTQVTGSCSGDQACDVTGACKTSNGKACTSAAACASGFCADGVCCNSACTGECVSCNQAGKEGTCTPYLAGTDPQKECPQGTPPCQSTCDGEGACFYPAGVTCGTCGYCNGTGACEEQWFCSTGTGWSTGTGINVPPIRDGGPEWWPVDAGTGTGTAIWTLSTPGTMLGTGGFSTGMATGSTDTGLGTGSFPTTVTRTARDTATATLSLSTFTATGTGTFSTALTTGTGTASLTGTGTSPQTATIAQTGTASTGNTTNTRTNARTDLPTGSGTAIVTGSGTGSRTGTATNSVSFGTATTSKTSTTTQAIHDAGADDGGATKLGKSGCSCDLGQKPMGGSHSTGWFGLLAALLFLSRNRRNRPKR